MKKFFRRVVGKRSGGQAAAPATDVQLSIFGKHPGWDDHMPGVGLEGPSVAAFKQALYVEGIGGVIDSGAWEKLETGSRLAGFDHQFLILDGQQVVTGQLWSSRDGKGRSSYPLVACASSQRLDPEALLVRASAELRALRTRLEKSASADQLLAAWRSSCFTLRLPLTSGGTNRILPHDWTESFLALQALGPDRVGLERIHHELAVGMGLEGATKGGRSRSEFKPFIVRVPSTRGAPVESLLMWAMFLRIPVPPPVSLALFARDDVDWLDALIGSPMAERLFCLQAGTAVLPVSSSVAYNLTSRDRSWTDQCVRRLLEEQDPTKDQSKPASSAERTQPEQESTKAVSGAKRKRGWLLAGVGSTAVVLGLGLAALYNVQIDRGAQIHRPAQLAQLSIWVEQHEYLRALSPTNQWPDDAAFSELLTHAEQERAERYAGTLHEANEALEAGNFDRALASVEDAARWQLAQEAGKTRALMTEIIDHKRIRQEQEDARARDELAKDRWRAAWLAALDQDNHGTVLAGIADLPKGWIDDPRFAALVERAQAADRADRAAALALAERNGKLEEWKRWLDQGEYQLLVADAGAVNARWPEDAEFITLLDQAGQMRRAAQQLAADLAARKQDYAQASELFLQGRYEQALAILGAHRTEHEKDSLEFDALRGQIETEHGLLRQVQQPDTDPFTLLARVDLPDKEPFRLARKEARDRALAQLDDWLAADRFEEMLDRLKDQPYADEEDFAQRMRLPQGWQQMRQAREQDQREEVQRMLKELGEDAERQPFQELAQWSREPDQDEKTSWRVWMTGLPRHPRVIPEEFIASVNRCSGATKLRLVWGTHPLGS
jgi:hypothetical protein